MTDLREVGAEELLATSDHPFVRHQFDPATTRRAWVSGRAAVVVHGPSSPARSRPPPVPSSPCLGPPDDLGPLMHELAPHIERPARLTVEERRTTRCPTRGVYDPHGHWHWMLNQGVA